MNTAVARLWPLVGRDRELADFREALVDPRFEACVIYGRAGCGKSRVAEECGKLAVEDGHRVVRVVGTAATRAIPLGALGHILPPGTDPADPAGLFALVAASLDATPPLTVLFVDDMHLLDTTSLVLLGQLLDGGRIFLLATMRTEPFTPGSPGGYDRGDRSLRIDLAHFNREQVDESLRLVLDGPVDPAAVFQLHRMSGGSPLYLRELVVGALDSGALAGDGGMWRLTGVPARTPRLVEALASHVRWISPYDRATLETVALCSPTPAFGLEPGSLSRLEKTGLIRLRSEERRTVVEMAHPLYADVVREGVPLVDRRRLLLEHAGRLEATGMRRREDHLRMAAWVLEATGTADPKLLSDAAMLARHARDFATLADLARALTRLDDGAPPRMLLGEALYELGRFDEADAVLEEAASVAADDLEYLLAVVLHTQYLVWAALRPADARRVHAAARQRLTAPYAVAALDAAEASMLVFCGEASAALDLIGDIARFEHPYARVMAALPKAWALVENARVNEALELARAAHEEHLTLPATATMTHPAMHLGPQIVALVLAGRIPEAIRLGEQGHAATVLDKALIPQMWIALYLGIAEYWAGHLGSARTWFTSAATAGEDHHFRSCQLRALTGLALTCAAAGDLDALDVAWGRMRELTPAESLRADQYAVSGWRAAAVGRLREAEEQLLRSARHARATGSLAVEAQLLSDVARLGDPQSAVARLGELAAQCDSALIEAYAEHAAASAARDADRLEAVGRRLEEMGADLLASESWARAAGLRRAAGDRWAAAQGQENARRLAERCGDARTPGLELVESDEPLTRREHEVALLAARGLTSQQIARHLVISVRTVDNHLMRVFRKTGITRRSDLRELLRC